MLELKNEHLFDAQFIVEGMHLVGEAGWGTRVIGPITGGYFEGPNIKGTAKNFGADWAIVRNDGVFDVDVRLLLETDDGALIHMEYKGIVDAAPEDLEIILAGGIIEKPIRVHTTPRFEAGHPDYTWLNRIAGAAIGELRTVGGGKFTLDYSVYALR